MSWHLWRVYTSMYSPLWHILVMQFLEARAPVFLPCTCSRHILQSAKQLPHPKQLSLPIFSAKQTCNLGTALAGKQTMTEALWVSSNFRWQVQNTGHRSDHKCRLEYRSPCNTLWCCKGAAVWMKGNKPMHKKL